ncbi:MAG: ATPase domain-containing protein, partial [Nitrososphaerota archaeon]
EDRWSLKSLDMEALVEKIIEAKKELGYGRARVAIDSLSAFWLDRPAMARRYSYYLKKVLSKWDFTILAVSQYAITTAESFGLIEVSDRLASSFDHPLSPLPIYHYYPMSHIMRCGRVSCFPLRP